MERTDRTGEILKRDRVVMRVLYHFVKKIEDMLSNDQSVKNFEIVNQGLIYSRNRILDIIYDMSKNCLDVTSFNYDKELKGIFDSYASDLEKLKKELLDKSWSNGIKYDSLDGELKIVHAVNLKIETRMN